MPSRRPRPRPACSPRPDDRPLGARGLQDVADTVEDVLPLLEHHPVIRRQVRLALGAVDDDGVDDLSSGTLSFTCVGKAAPPRPTTPARWMAAMISFGSASGWQGSPSGTSWIELGWRGRRRSIGRAVMLGIRPTCADRPRRRRVHRHRHEARPARRSAGRARPPGPPSPPGRRACPCAATNGTTSSGRERELADRQLPRLSFDSGGWTPCRKVFNRRASILPQLYFSRALDPLVDVLGARSLGRPGWMT
jgi:hypothetical protein